ncbi:hypothetical protein FHL81_10810 [Agrobacterium tumefaciens]|uniref:hypothetical protein n=1 Tax=Agrobacterium tumefaciens TaxID=358 RepID=UPI0011F29F1F|nr:hypothetical protein [Agrobacterium tumefaciens]KAA1237121.1 hypothetical protein FHL81_10810 [Agrobacterium tumefaciens]
MTCIVALQHNGKVYVGGDASATCTWSLYSVAGSTPKVFEKDEMIIGSAGSPREAQIIRHLTTFPRCHPDVDATQHIVATVVECIRSSLRTHGALQVTDNVESMESSLIIAFRDQLFDIDGKFSVIQSDRPFTAIGSGRDLALGSLHTSIAQPEARVQLALEAAEAFNAGVRRPFTIRMFGDVDKEAA